MGIGINLTMLVVVIIFIIGAIKGWKMGLVQELVSLISFVLLVIVLLLVTTGIQSFMDRKYIQIIFIIILLVIVGIATKIGSLIFKLGKSVAKLPVLSVINKLAGIVIGIAEGVVLVWVGMIAMIIFENNSLCQTLIQEVNENAFLHYIYETNLLAHYFL
jgi:uncharacterized membrane protein required for colicin V production